MASYSPECGGVDAVELTPSSAFHLWSLLANLAISTQCGDWLIRTRIFHVREGNFVLTCCDVKMLAYSKEVTEEPSAVRNTRLFSPVDVGFAPKKRVQFAKLALFHLPSC